MARSVLAFLMLPTMIAGLIPWLLSRGAGGATWSTPWGSVPAALGALIVVAATVSFWRRGRGTLAPWDPPRRLVVEDLYRFNRNPMYVGVTLVVLGWVLVTGHLACWLWSIVVPIAFHLRVVLYEEPTMAASFGDDWERYRAAVPRWGVTLTGFRDGNRN